jgi:hypothetical protein
LQELMKISTFGFTGSIIDLSRIVHSVAWNQLFRRQNFSLLEHLLSVR